METPMSEKRKELLALCLENAKEISAHTHHAPYNYYPYEIAVFCNFDNEFCMNYLRRPQQSVANVSEVVYFPEKLSVAQVLEKIDAEMNGSYWAKM